MTNPETALLDNEYFTPGEQTFILTDLDQDVSAIRNYVLAHLKADFIIFASAVSSSLEKLLVAFDNVSLSYELPEIEDLESADKIVFAVQNSFEFSTVESETERLRIPSVYIVDQNPLFFATAA